MPTARTRANRKFNEKAYDRLYPTTQKGKKVFYEIASRLGGEEASLNDFIITAIEDKIKAEAPEVYAAMMEQYKDVATAINSGIKIDKVESLEDLEEKMKKQTPESD